MTKYAPLGAFLRQQSLDEVPMTFDDIERIIRAKLPESSHRYRAWWSNNAGNSVMTQVWLDAGFKSEQVDIEGRKLVFRRVGHERGPGMAQDAKGFAGPTEAAKAGPRRSPLFGCMKGTFWIDPNWDLTKPALDADELAKWEASLDRKADLIEAGFSRKK